MAFPASGYENLPVGALCGAAKIEDEPGGVARDHAADVGGPDLPLRTLLHHVGVDVVPHALPAAEAADGSNDQEIRTLPPDFGGQRDVAGVQRFEVFAEEPFEIGVVLRYAIIHCNDMSGRDGAGVKESPDFEHARAAVKAARAVAVLTGAGVSAGSGIPTFRSNGGHWRQFRFEDLATPEAFERDPKFVWTWYEERRRGIQRAQPNAGHRALAELERAKPEFTLITQNVDDLHDRAGSRNVVRLHGDIRVLRCVRCRREEVVTAELESLPPYCDCGGIERPGVVWFGEALPEGAMERASEAVRRCEVLIVAGTSAQVYPAAGLIPLAIRGGAAVIEVNPEETEFSDEVTFALRGGAAEVLPRLL